MYQARLRTGLSQVEAAKRAGLNLSSLKRYETGARVPTVAAAERLAAAYGVPLAAILPAGGTGEPHPEYARGVLETTARMETLIQSLLEELRGGAATSPGGGEDALTLAAEAARAARERLDAPAAPPAAPDSTARPGGGRRRRSA